MEIRGRGRERERIKSAKSGGCGLVLASATNENIHRSLLTNELSLERTGKFQDQCPFADALIDEDVRDAGKT